jgi:hypothetical protein
MLGVQGPAKTYLLMNGNRKVVGSEKIYAVYKRFSY